MISPLIGKAPVLHPAALGKPLDKKGDMVESQNPLESPASGHRPDVGRLLPMTTKILLGFHFDDGHAPYKYLHSGQTW